MLKTSKNRPVRIPSYRKHKPTGQAVVTISGRDFYLGKYNSAASRVEYNRLIAEFAASGGTLPQQAQSDLTVAELLSAFLSGERNRGGEKQGRVQFQACFGERNRDGRVQFQACFGERNRDGRVQFQACFGLPGDRKRLDNDPLEGQVILFAEKELLPPNAPIEHVINVTTGSTSGSARHAQRLLGRPTFVNNWTRPRSSPCGIFSPDRKTPVYPSEIRARERRKAERAKRSGNRRKAPRERYDTASYRRAIASGMEAANRALRAAAKAEGLEESQVALIPHWHPHQLRHNAATNLRKEHGIEVARIILGHRSAAITEVYAEVDHARAIDVMGKVG